MDMGNPREKSPKGQNDVSTLLDFRCVGFKTSNNRHELPSVKGACFFISSELCRHRLVPPSKSWKEDGGISLNKISAVIGVPPPPFLSMETRCPPRHREPALPMRFSPWWIAATWTPSRRWWSKDAFCAAETKRKTQNSEVSPILDG